MWGSWTQALFVAYMIVSTAGGFYFVYQNRKVDEIIVSLNETYHFVQEKVTEHKIRVSVVTLAICLFVRGCYLLFLGIRYNLQKTQTSSLDEDEEGIENEKKKE